MQVAAMVDPAQGADIGNQSGEHGQASKPNDVGPDLAPVRGVLQGCGLGPQACRIGALRRPQGIVPLSAKVYHPLKGPWGLLHAP
ncbi:hypothetical protein GCM10023209_17420 [Roseibacterium beibuensis]|uniref:Uncharacterized protein n=1 Tax=[Roseibacterium] beibuensis TaxID=1193142 RepID=A0ABP9L753_9RHOB